MAGFSPRDEVRPRGAEPMRMRGRGPWVPGTLTGSPGIPSIEGLSADTANSISEDTSQYLRTVREMCLRVTEVSNSADFRGEGLRLISGRGQGPPFNISLESRRKPDSLRSLQPSVEPKTFSARHTLPSADSSMANSKLLSTTREE